MIGPLTFITCWVIAGAVRDGYDVRNDAISRLAELGAPNRWLVLAGIMVVSVSSIVLGVLVGRRWHVRFASVVTVIAGSSALALGVFPCSAGCPGISGEFTDTMHSVAAVIHYITFGLSPLLIAIASKNYTPTSYKAFSIFVTVFAGAFLFSQFIGWGPNGLTQRIGLTTLDTWMIATALLLLRPPQNRAPLTPPFCRTIRPQTGPIVRRFGAFRPFLSRRRSGPRLGRG